MKNKLGQITITGSIISGVIAVGIFVAGALGNWINKVDSKSEKALGQTAELSSKIDVLVNDVQWIRQIMEKQQKLQINK